MIGDERFLAEGAQASCGALILKNKLVGEYRDNVFLITPYGRERLAELELITDVVEKPTKTKKGKAEPLDLETFA